LKIEHKFSVKELGTRWWTSGTDKGCPGKIAWCGSGEMYSEQEMGPLNGSSSSNDKCVVLKAMSKTGELSLGVASCSENNRPLCEVNQRFCPLTHVFLTFFFVNLGKLSPI
jgi:hypothetical protein